MYDLIIIGAGASGINAAIYAGRSKLNTLVIEKEVPGGKLNSIKEINNFLGHENITGPNLASIFYKQFKSLNVPLKKEEVLNIEIKNEIKYVITTKETYQTKAIIIAAGSGQKKLKNFEHIKGISYCALCDANLYENKTVMLIGNNNKVIEEAKYLSDIVDKLYLVYNNDANINKDNIELVNYENIVNIKEENDIITEVVLDSKSFKVDGLFVNLGTGPSNYFCTNLEITDNNGFIIVNDKCETSIPGIYAVGDVIKKDMYQIINGASEGAIAAVNAGRYIRKN